MPSIPRTESPTWRHYFGGFGVIMLSAQLLTGLFLALFYEPSLKEAYKSVQHLTNEVFGGSLARNLHRWIALSLFLAAAIHTIRTTLRMDFLDPTKKVSWLTGVLVMGPLMLLVLTGLILPWEWKGYWFMEMVPNYFAEVPLIGPWLKGFFLTSFTLPRYEVLHILILPLLTLIILDYHFLTKFRRKGIFRLMARHLVAGLPFVIVLIVLALKVTIPSEDPDTIPMPLEGEYVPVAEWVPLTVLLPFLYFKGAPVFLLSILLPLAIYIGVAFLPYYAGRLWKAQDGDGPGLLDGLIERLFKGRGAALEGHTVALAAKGAVVTVIFAFVFALFYLGSYNSPTLGCNSCHNVYSGIRMGIPPEDFKIREKLPNLDDNEWMVGHWYYPQIIW